MSTPPDPPAPAERRPAAEALTIVTTTVVVGCLTVSALATGWVVLAGLGGDWARLIAFLGLSVAGLALLAVAPHALMLRWIKRYRRSPISPWPTLAAVAATAIPFPATLLTISREPLMLFNVLIATLGVLLFVEIILMVHLSEHDKRRIGISRANGRDGDAGHD